VFLLMLGVGMMVALLPSRIIGLSGSFSDVGWLAAAFAVPFVLLQVPVGGLADKYGFKVFLMAGYALCCLSGLFYFVADTPRLIFLGRALQGVGECPVWSLGPALSSIHHPASKGKMAGIYNASIHLGLTCGSLLGLLTSRIWQGSEAFLLFAGVSALGAIVIASCAESGSHRLAPAKERKAEVGNMTLLAGDRTVRAVLVGITLYGCGYGVLLTVIPAVLMNRTGPGEMSVGLYFVLFYIALSLSQLIAGPLSDRKGRGFTMIGGLAMAVSGLALFSGLSQQWPCLPYASLSLASFGFGVFGVSSIAFLNDRVPASSKGIASGAFYLSWGIGYFTGPLVLGKMADLGYFEVSILALAALLLSEAAVLAPALQSGDRVVSVAGKQ
jgi:MFS family permease